MKKLNKKLVSLLVGAGLLISSSVYAWGGGYHGGKHDYNRYDRSYSHSYNQERYQYRTEFYKIKIAVLAKLSKTSKNNIKSKLENKPFWAVMDEYKITKDDLHKAMLPEIKSKLEKKVKDGDIGKNQAKYMLERIEENFKSNKSSFMGRYHSKGWRRNSNCSGNDRRWGHKRHGHRDSRGWEHRNGRKWGHNMPMESQMKSGNRAALLPRALMYKAKLDLLTEMTGKSKKIIAEKLNNKPLWAILDEYKIPLKQFQEKMFAKHKTEIKKLIDDGKVTKEDGELILKRMEARRKAGFGNRRFN